MIKRCALCQNKFIATTAWDKRKRRFCNSVCLKKAIELSVCHKPPKNLQIIHCRTCGNEFYAFPSQKKKYCSRQCFRDDPHRGCLEKGYVILSRKKGIGRIRQHVAIAESVIGRKLKSNEVVHHFNMIKTDNRKSNLLICDTSYHVWLHLKYERRFAEIRLGRVYV